MLASCWVTLLGGGWWVIERTECHQDCLPCIGTTSGYLGRVAIRKKKLLKVKVWVASQFRDQF